MAGGGASTEMEPSALVPTEDTIEALMDFLVYPLLPIRDSPQKPTISLQKLVAKQMGAVVLLYNYYHRKQFPQLEFLGFESFCKSASIAKPSLLMYMKSMCGESGDLDKQLSITEKMVMDACHMCTALDASKDAPNMEEWPISKVAVFLVDHTKKNCLLEFSSITHGVWSLVEIACDNLGGAPQMENALEDNRTGSECSGDRSLANEDELQQLAFSVVEQKTGINRANLSILERHLAYSLTQEKTATRLYFMQYIGTVNEEITELPIKDVMSSLQGPLVMRSPTPEVTPVVEHYHLLAYTGILSDWLSRETHHGGSLPLPRQRTNVDEHCSLEPEILLNMKGREISDSSFGNGQTRDFQNIKMGKTFNETAKSEGNGKYCRTGSYGGVCKAENQADSASLEPDQFPTIEIHEMNDKPHRKGQTVNIQSNKTCRDENKIINKKGNGKSCMSGSSGAVCRPQNMADSSSLHCPQKPLPNEVDIRSTDDVISDTHSDKNEKTSSIHRGIDVTVDGLKDKADNTIDSVKKSQSLKSIGGRLLGREHTPNDGILVQDRISVDDVPVQFNSQNCDTFHLVMASKENDLLQASGRVLQKKRDELCHQQRPLGDEIALCEMNLQRILTDGEENLMLQIDSIVEACNELCSSRMRMDACLYSGAQRPYQKIKRRRLSEAVLHFRSACQELDDICCENNWILPRYSVLPSLADGRFQANITIQGMDFEFTGAGDLKSNPYEARESAATHMLSKLRSMASQAQ